MHGFIIAMLGVAIMAIAVMACPSGSGPILVTQVLALAYMAIGFVIAMYGVIKIK